MSAFTTLAARRRRTRVGLGILALLLLAAVLVLNRAHDSARLAEASGTPSVDLSMAVVGAGCDTKNVDVADKCDVPGTDLTVDQDESSEDVLGRSYDPAQRVGEVSWEPEPVI